MLARVTLEYAIAFSCTWVLAGHSVGVVSAGSKANGSAFGLHLAKWDLRVPRMAYVNFYTSANHVGSVSSFLLCCLLEMDWLENLCDVRTGVS
ncbi:hypothetical protein OAG76_03350 [Rubripirellula sp.]|nr:hypothetical protein [Rubripirellula sp.]MDB4634422.1 hypothetical protein [Rubripirellula sp.]MDC0317479.1 hypothetical protein [bacterium]